MDNLKLLDEILLSQNACEIFYNEYKNNLDFKNWLINILPQVEKCEKQEQNNPWHKYNVLEHILHSVEEMNKQTINLDYKVKRMLAYVMFYHDIGKPEKHITRVKDGKTIDSFFDHNIKSEEIAKNTLSQFNFNESEIKVMLKLIYKHDIFMFIKTYKSSNQYWRVLDNNLIKEEIQDLSSVGNGKQLLQYLILVGKSDNLAQNEKMTQESLQMLNIFEEMLQNIN